MIEGQADATQALSAGELGEAPATAEGRRDPRRSRDRYGRDRRERGGREDQAGAEAAPVQQEAIAGEQEAAERRPRYATGFVSDEAAPATATPEPQAPPQPVAVATPAPAQAPAVPSTPVGLPKVQKFDLPVDQLAQVAADSGLQWVNSDAEKIAAVQAAIAAEPKPIRVPRERPPAVVIDEGPLVLVETRRDLRDMKLPFEQQQPPQAPVQ